MHEMAYENLLAAYKAWKSAMPSIQASTFLSKVLETGQAGQWAAEVAKFLLSQNSLEELFPSRPE
ncbi:MAG: hypothetical protein JTT11_00340 [Candidatus Brockarchaeota archaeon]|nr:hypothetical protein [Candidatus Brockarchaeota archaeon]